MNNHQGIKAEIDARNDSFTACIELGKALLARKHYASEEVETHFTPNRFIIHIIHAKLSTAGPLSSFRLQILISRVHSEISSICFGLVLIYVSVLIPDWIKNSPNVQNRFLSISSLCFEAFDSILYRYPSIFNLI